jgi:hypothetical protein
MELAQAMLKASYKDSEVQIALAYHYENFGDESLVNARRLSAVSFIAVSKGILKASALRDGWGITGTKLWHLLFLIRNRLMIENRHLSIIEHKIQDLAKPIPIVFYYAVSGFFKGTVRVLKKVFVSPCSQCYVRIWAVVGLHFCALFAIG